MFYQKVKGPHRLFVYSHFKEHTPDCGEKERQAEICAYESPTNLQYAKGTLLVVSLEGKGSEGQESGRESEGKGKAHTSLMLTPKFAHRLSQPSR